MLISCVLKWDGDFNEDYVFALYDACLKYANVDFAFVCFTDRPERLNPYKDKINIIDLFPGREGWWNKFQTFMLMGKVLYFDLDTVILNSIEPMINTVSRLANDEFIGVRAFNPKRNKFEKTQFNSGVMGWNGDFRFVLEEFNYEKDSVNPKYLGDQDRISEILRSHNIKIKFWQDRINLYSYKRHCKTSLPKDAQVVCFHGKPRPHEKRDLPWVEEYWKGDRVDCR